MWQENPHLKQKPMFHGSAYHRAKNQRLWKQGIPYSSADSSLTSSVFHKLAGNVFLLRIRILHFTKAFFAFPARADIWHFPCRNLRMLIASIISSDKQCHETGPRKGLKSQYTCEALCQKVGLEPGSTEVKVKERSH